MFRLIFVFGIIAVGAFYSLQGPFYALLFYLWYAYFRPEYWVWTDILWSLRLSLIIGTFLLLVSLPSLYKLRWSWLNILLLLFLLHSGLSVAFSSHQELAMPFWIEFLKVIVITLLMTFLVDSEKRYRLTLAVIAFSLGFETAKQGWAQFVLNPGATNNNPHLMLGDNNGVALGMMMLIPIFLALSQTAHNHWERYIHRFFIGGVVYRGISTYSRAGFLAAAVVGVVSLWRAKHKVRTLVIVAVLAAAVAGAMPQQFWDRMQTISASQEERDESAQGRLYFWGIALEMAADHPWLGVGFNSYRYSFDDYDMLEGSFGSERAVHSSWFGTVAELGYPGLLIFVVILYSALASSYRIKRRATEKGLTNIATYAAHIQTSLFVFLVGGTFLNAQYLELLWHFVGLTIALEGIYLRAAAEQAAVPATQPAVAAPAPRPRFHPQTVPPRAATGTGRFFARSSDRS